MAWPQELTMLSKVRRKCRVEYWLAALLLAAAAAMLAYAGVTLLAAPFPALSPWRLPLAFLAAAAVAVVMWRVQPGDLEIARRLDKDLASEERVQTLVENRQGQSPMLQQLRRETADYFRRRQPRYRWDKKRFFAPALLSGAAAVILILSIVFSPHLAQSIAQRREVLEQQQEAAEQIEEIIELLPENPLGEELAAQLEDLLEQVYSLTAPGEFETLLREALELLESEREQAAAIESALEELLAAMNMPPEELAEALGDPEFAAQLAEAMNNLAETLPGGMDLASALKELAANPSAAEASHWQQIIEQLEELDPSAYRENLQQAVRAAEEMCACEENSEGEGEGEGSGKGEGEGSGEGEGEGEGGGNSEGGSSGSNGGEGFGSG
ncbi:MAG: hypothetical protein GX065_06255, partial [Firmicutes bacterium]|nr:hypothetical protein [Bacillota bacterium]